MKKIGKFLFVEQCFTDTEETKPCIIHIDAIDNIVCTNHSKLGEFENLISEEEEQQSIK